MTQIIPLIPRRVIPQEEVTVAQLSFILDRAFIDYEIEEDGDLYLTDGLESPCWVTIDTDRKLLIFFTFDEIEEKPESELLILINKMNKNIASRRIRIWCATARRFAGQSASRVSLIACGKLQK